MKKIFLDTNVLLDFLLDRKPFTDDVAEIIRISLDQSIQLCVSSVTVTDINYIIGRIEGRKKANNKTGKLLKIVSVENVGQSTVLKSSASSFRDFEDGVQNFCAIEANHSMIITRNVKDFKESALSILTPKELLAKMIIGH